MRIAILSLTSICLINSASGAIVSDLEDVTVGTDGTFTSPTFNSRGITWGGQTGPYSDGFVVSNHTDTASYGADQYKHQYDAITGAGAGGSNQYAIANNYAMSYVLLPGDPVSIEVTNNTYAYYSMLNGDSFAKKFGGSTGHDADWFLLTITGRDLANSVVGTVQTYLADFRSADNANDYILNSWRTVDLSGLADARRLEFTLASSDTGTWGMNTPAYFAADSLTAVPEPAGLTVLALGSLLVLRRRK